MFKKKPSIKTLSPLRSSDRRKTADRIISDYNLQPPTSANDQADDTKAAATAAHTKLRNALLPDNTLSAKFTTTSGPELRVVTGTVYVGSHGSGEQRVLWVKIEERLYPTVYTLWKNPGIVPLLHTPSMVVSKLQGGADLMTPGLAGPPFPAGAKKDAVVAIASLDSPSVPVAVGVCEVEIASLRRAQGEKGRAVRTVHWFGDELWDWSTSGKAGSAAPESLQRWIHEEDVEALAEKTDDVDLDDEDEGSGGVALQQENPPQSKQAGQRRDLVEGEDAIAEVIDLDGIAEADMAQQDIDHAFRQAFLYGVREQELIGSAPKYGLVFPLAQSYVMSSLVLPYLPAFTAKQAEALVIKRTSWKSVRKFIKALDKEKLLLCKERPGNEVDVLDIDFEDHQVRDFVPYRLPRKDIGSGNNDSQPATHDAGDDESIGQKIKKVDLFKPKDAIAPLFISADSNHKSLYKATEIRSIVSAYAESAHLVSDGNKRLVNLDPLLSNALFTTSSKIDNEFLAKGSCPRDALIERVLQHCAPFHMLLRNDETEESPKAKARAGPAPRVQMTLETRSGNKTATKVHGLEAFYIAPQQLADELRKACASSTSVEPFKGGKGMEVMVQGPQQAHVMKALEKRGVGKAFVEFVDKTKGGKKK